MTDASHLSTRYREPNTCSATTGKETDKNAACTVREPALPTTVQTRKYDVY
ncbi:hypothetical protein CBOM_00768 [Ceraceosorus bombacis]|uniref:Uncharacterized protein n=1 Tax=Ceraceosorus bombacis TaxID=401625 RepID=A0A0P1A4A1_9BASI|nr:hypothetical protein CBOM_00768 [Ceraceosorus bombacis]